MNGTMEEGNAAAENVVGRAYVGTSTALSEKQTLEFIFHDFKSLPFERDDCTETPSLMCHGYQWTVDLYPAGYSCSSESKVNLSLYLKIGEKPAKPVKVKLSFQIGPETEQMECEYEDSGDAFGFHNFAKRSDVLDPAKGFLSDDGALVVKVCVQVYMKELPHWSPKDNMQVCMLELLKSSKRADVVFIVGEKRFPAHRVILSFRSPVLDELADNADGQEVLVPGVDPELFGVFLRFIYGSEMPPPSCLKDHARDLLEISDRFGCSNFKLKVEFEVIHHFINPDNASDWLLFADSHSCALLKEVAIDIINMHRNAVLETDGWKQLEESPKILKELWQATSTNRAPANDGEIENMDVSTLRRKLEEKGLPVDGSREMLIASLKKARE